MELLAGHHHTVERVDWTSHMTAAMWLALFKFQQWTRSMYQRHQTLPRLITWRVWPARLIRYRYPRLASLCTWSISVDPRVSVPSGDKEEKLEWENVWQDWSVLHDRYRCVHASCTCTCTCVQMDGLKKSWTLYSYTFHKPFWGGLLHTPHIWNLVFSVTSAHMTL